ncbi:MAG: aryl-sulfate sulfotransferase, partial [Gemmatimonadales bacterium]|nr:aryl-sulfate sulfotransferase [Gemmatimonadales bacterium]
MALVAVALAAVAVAAGCAGEPTAPATPIPPRIVASTVVPGSFNVLSASVEVDVRKADSVKVLVHALGNPSIPDTETPAVSARGDTASIPVLGLRPVQRYLLQPVAYRGRISVVGDSLSFLTGTVPPDLPQFVAGGSSPSPGYVVLASGGYGLVLDNAGQVVWYRAFADGPGLNFMASQGYYAARPMAPGTTDVHPWVELDAMGRVTRTFGCARNLEPRFHDWIREADGGYWIMCDETRTMDLSTLGGRPAALVTGTVVQHIGGTGVLLFEWSAFDHFALVDLDPADRLGPMVNWTHGNAIAIDADGNLLVSFRSLSEITKISTTTGAVIWRFGGRANQFAFDGAPLPAFIGQHGLRITGPGELLILDNRGEATGTRVERYQLDEAAHTAHRVGALSSPPAVVGLLGGSVQQLAGGRVLASYGSGRKVEEYDAAGAAVWELSGGGPAYLF